MTSPKSNKKIVHNPKSNAPALFIPNWLCQVPILELSFGAKILYGRLAQWSNEAGHVYRTVGSLAKEIGVSTSSVEKYIKELKDVVLIDTFQNQKGGQNNYIFYEHPWMYEPIKKELVYINDLSHTPPVKDEVIHNPPQDPVVPPVRSYGTPPYDLTVINKKENNKEISSSSYSAKPEKSPQTTTTEKLDSKSKNQKPVTGNGPFAKVLATIQDRMARHNASTSASPTNKDILTSDKDCLDAFQQKFGGTYLTIDKLYDKFVTMNDETKRTVSRFLKFIDMEKKEKWTTSNNFSLDPSSDEAAVKRMFEIDVKELTESIISEANGTLSGESYERRCDWDILRRTYRREFNFLKERYSVGKTYAA